MDLATRPVHTQSGKKKCVSDEMGREDERRKGKEGRTKEEQQQQGEELIDHQESDGLTEDGGEVEG